MHVEEAVLVYPMPGTLDLTCRSLHFEARTATCATLDGRIHPFFS